MFDYTSTPRPFAKSRVVELITKRIAEISHKKSQREIAAEVGYDKPNMLSMIKRGDSKLPIEKVPSLAKALQVDERLLLELALEQFVTTDLMERYRISALSRDELSLILEIRNGCHDKEALRKNPLITQICSSLDTIHP